MEVIAIQSNYLLLIALSVLCSYIILSFAEVWFHRTFMHRKLPKYIYRIYPDSIQVFEAHAIRHHGKWYREFDFEPDPEGRHDNILLRPIDIIASLVVFSPVVILLFMISTLLGVTFIVVGLLHSKLWNLLHAQMHMPKPVFFAKWAGYRWLARYHYMHHQRNNRNYNIVFPLADYLLGMQAKPRLRDLRQMLYLGYLIPRSERVKVQVKKKRAEREKRRAALLSSSA